MKLSNGFDARRLRPREPRSWRLRAAFALGALLAAFGILLAMAGAATLLGQPAALGPLNDSVGASVTMLVIGLILLWSGIGVWRMCRRRLRRPSDLSMPSHLMKKRD
ncbi:MULTISPECIES: hypothetical protein [Pseudomonas]|uniref:Uncharacterized protein n=1 Tax=Pseudomonas marincola TaxID=437900 RepID=A0A1I6XFF4_9PSED|nr:MULTISPECIES: hypothetical protein [Pseudomonas]MBQ55098.1 hypothetical protein [Pseudomonadaceae bacterium]NRH29145.1 hypothetical protein [Pseudomonas sp. MS19]OEO26210.1 hypothetical protein AX279_05075 [Pseudomonas sp. J237]CAE6924649.1 conserved protein of unknown function [Pseudomonas marincola]SFT36811.1 hypothetical protein SAMN05216264_10150 [Pseudomonas marincola]|tara:strand:+ start:210 stop:530 length:321 start_codon:yes stop_codon:yes gene_type:complete